MRYNEVVVGVLSVLVVVVVTASDVILLPPEVENPVRPIDPIGPLFPRGVCLLPIVRGPCEANSVRYAFDASVGQCVPFIYGGCEGNGNNFNSRIACRRRCGLATVPIIPPTPRCPPNQLEVACFVAPCSTKSCPAFPEAQCTNNYCGGCHAIFTLPNGRRLTDADCASFDRAPPVDLAALALPPCRLPIVRGPCRAAFRRYAFNSQLGRCVPFIYGGCQGNANNFDSLTSCTARCPPPRCATPLVNCLVSPCATALCRPPSICIDNYCGGCNAICVQPDGSHILANNSTGSTA